MMLERGSAARYRAKHLRRKNGGKARRGGGPSREGRAVLRLTVCGIIFVLLVAIKLLFPQTVSRLARTAGELIGRDADFREAFAAMGRAVSGEETVGDSLQDAYAAVFSPDSGEDAVLANAGAEVYLEAPARLARLAASPLPEPAGEAADEASADRAAGGVPAETEEPVHTAETESPASPQTAAEDAPAVRETAAEPEEETATAAASQVYTMPALPENASLEQRNLGFAHVSPIAAPLTSPFGWREHPVTGGTKFHYGVDLGAETGTDICAFADGTVYATGDSSSLGYYIMIQHQDGYMTLYAHCSKITVTSGAVTMGQKIAEVGETGVATGPHLHFELHDGDLYLNPIYYVEVR